MESGASAGGNANCFDYYRFGSVQVPITPSLTATVPGAPMSFSGTVQNENNYPIIDGAVYVKVFKLQDSLEKSVNGPDVVDQFFAKKDLIVPANGEVPIEFAWEVPAWAGEGEYQVATYFVSGDKYNLLGLSFTDDVVGNVAYFNVTADGVDREVYLDKGTVTYPQYDLPHLFAGFPHRFDATEPVDIAFNVINTTNAVQNVPITYTIYSWDAMSEENVVATVTKTVSAAANQSTSIVYTLEDTEHPVYLVEVNMKYQDTSSVLNIRFVREGISKLRINFPSITQYPLVAGEENKVFSCLHNVSDAYENGKMVLTLFGEQGRKIHSFEYEGEVGGQVMGVVDAFTPSETYTTFSLKAELYQDDVLVDEDTIFYNCSDFATCETESEASTNPLTASPSLLKGILFLVLLIALVLIIKKIKPKKQ